jgi:hypothetical protein
MCGHAQTLSSETKLCLDGIYRRGFVCCLCGHFVPDKDDDLDSETFLDKNRLDPTEMEPRRFGNW